MRQKYLIYIPRFVIIVFSESKSALDLSKTTKHHDRTKHVKVRHHFFRQHIEDGRIRFIHTPTEFMLADAMTKPLGKEKFAACRDGIGIVELQESRGRRKVRTSGH
jgi:hypothetical protein